MSALARLVSVFSAVFGEPCERCGRPISSYPLFGASFGPDLAAIHSLLTLDNGEDTGPVEQEVVALVDRVAAYLDDPRPHSDGVMAHVKWCKSCEHGALIFRLTARGSHLEEFGYSLFSEGHKQFARSVSKLHASREAATRDGPTSPQARSA